MAADGAFSSVEEKNRSANHPNYSNDSMMTIHHEAEAPLIDSSQARNFLRALCATTVDPTIVFQCVDDAKKDRPGLTEHRAGTVLKLIGYLRAQNLRGAAIFFQVNAGGRGDAGINTPRALVIDDDLKSSRRPDLTRLPPSAIVRSSRTTNGDEKRHYYWFLKENEPLGAWLPAMQHLAKVHATDIGVCKLSLVMRLPGFFHNKSAAQRTELLFCDTNRRFTIAEILAAFPNAAPQSNGTQHNANGVMNGTVRVNGTTNGTGNRYARVDAALADIVLEEIPSQKGADGKDPDVTPHTEASKVTFQRICEWLKRIGEPFTTRAVHPRFIYLTRGCPRNRDHKDAVLIAGTRGGIIAKCFHDSCGGNKQSWADFKNILGSWAELKRGDQVELAIRLRNELRAEYKSEILTESGHKLAAVHRYETESGAWRAFNDEAVSGRIMNYAGVPFGEKGTPKKLNSADVQGTSHLLKILCAQPAFFEQAPAGALFTNGFLIIQGKQLKLLPHSEDHRARAPFPFSYNPEAKAPRWEKTLQEIFEKDRDKDQKIAFMQEFFGVCFLGIATRYQRSLFLTGEGSNGKSVCLKILSALFPPAFISAVRPQDMDDEYRRALLYRKRINIVSEVPEKEIFNTGGFKAMIDGSLIDGRPIREAPITFSPTAAHVFACNTLPHSKDFSEGFWRRIEILTFNREFARAEQDRRLADTIIENELEGVCNWCLIGGQRVLEQSDMNPPPSSIEAKAIWRAETDAVALFVSEETEPCGPIFGAATEDLYQAFRIWAEENGHYSMSKVAFSHRLVRRKIEHARRKIGGNARTIFNIHLLKNYNVGEG